MGIPFLLSFFTVHQSRICQLSLRPSVFNWCLTDELDECRTKAHPLTPVHSLSKLSCVCFPARYGVWRIPLLLPLAHFFFSSFTLLQPWGGAYTYCPHPTYSSQSCFLFSVVSGVKGHNDVTSEQNASACMFRISHFTHYTLMSSQQTKALCLTCLSNCTFVMEAYVCVCVTQAFLCALFKV